MTISQVICSRSDQPDNAATEEVNDHGQKQPSLRGRDVGYVTDPHLIRYGHPEVAIQIRVFAGEVIIRVCRQSANRKAKTEVDTYSLQHDAQHIGIDLIRGLVMSIQ
jgi:hypothetical protein